MKVRDIMHRGAVCLDDDTPLREVARKMREADVGAIPISAGGELVGIVTDRDIACRAVADGSAIEDLRARDVMTREPACCFVNDDLEAAVQLMERRRVRRLPVMSDQDLVGMVSLGDISSRAGERYSAQLLQAVASHH